MRQDGPKAVFWPKNAIFAVSQARPAVRRNETSGIVPVTTLKRKGANPAATRCRFHLCGGPSPMRDPFPSAPTRSVQAGPRFWDAHRATGASRATAVAWRNCVDVWPYLTDVLRRIAAIASGDTAALEALLPDRWVAEHPDHRLEQWEEESGEAQARPGRKGVARRAAVAL